MTSAVMSLAINHWSDFDGWCAARGVDPEKLPLRRFLALVWHWRCSFITDEAELQRVTEELWRPPTHIEEITVGPWSAEAEMAAFKQAQRGFSAG